MEILYLYFLSRTGYSTAYRGIQEKLPFRINFPQFFSQIALVAGVLLINLVNLNVVLYFLFPKASF